jgi:hypothetical protein
MARPRIHYRHCQWCGALIPPSRGILYCNRACYVAYRLEQSRLSAARRLATHTIKSEGCWEWTGARTHGYGRIGYEGRVILTHRLAYDLAYGSVPSDVDVLHHCDNPACVRPDHLFLGTAKDNAQDMMAKGRGGYRTWRGEENGHAKLTRIQVASIRAEYATGKVSQRNLARQYGMAQTTIGAILRGKTWKDERDA